MSSPAPRTLKELANANVESRNGNPVRAAISGTGARSRAVAPHQAPSSSAILSCLSSFSERTIGSRQPVRPWAAASAKASFSA